MLRVDLAAVDGIPGAAAFDAPADGARPSPAPRRVQEEGCLPCGGDRNAGDSRHPLPGRAAAVFTGEGAGIFGTTPVRAKVTSPPRKSELQRLQQVVRSASPRGMWLGRTQLVSCIVQTMVAGPARRIKGLRGTLLRTTGPGARRGPHRRSSCLECKT